MDIYNNLLYVEKPGEEKFIYNNKTYYRYMDRIYIPSPPSELSIEDVTSLSEIRIMRNGAVIDYSYTKELISHLLTLIPAEHHTKMIDFGCGGGILDEVITENPSLFKSVKEIIGLDICQFAVEYSIKKYASNTKIKYSAYKFSGSEPLKIKTNSINSVLSSFVMHFPIYENQLEELYRVLVPGGYFVYNDYIHHRYAGHTKRIIHRLMSIGFEVKAHPKGFEHPDTGDLKMHKIITARKPISNP
ncbi:methyltransferase domain-containing protein [Aeromonas caviae]|uniref:methyltransferase domain-containing protein n=1 Tax=Aeromonas TaxID=642 RepID=UPI00191E1825|nr:MULTISPECIES: methyltransferase domain-containing protein [Aeromonas]MBL0559274.1 methyltransferase domain-containing protein [Aeromonas hydrophila]MDY7784244.1 methyltransferase domain-containing protein [Aeromonas caviae]